MSHIERICIPWNAMICFGSVACQGILFPKNKMAEKLGLAQNVLPFLKGEFVFIES